MRPPAQFALSAVVLIAVPLAGAQTVSLAPCTVASLAARCGAIQVAEHAGSTRGKVIALNTVVIPAKNGDHRIALVELAGGPGQAATSGAAGVTQQYAELLGERDFVLFDQRGTGTSNAFDCSAGTTAASLSAWLRLTFPRDSIDACRARFSGDATAYSTTAAVDDLEQVRRALGYAQMDLVGVSYGTRVAIEYARRYPTHTRSVVVRGVSPLGARLPLHVAADAHAALIERSAECKRIVTCAARVPDLVTAVQQVLERLNRVPVAVPIFDTRASRADTLVITKDIAAGALVLSLYADSPVVDLAAGIAAALEGRIEAFLGTGILATHNITRSLNLGAYLAVVCTEDVPFIQESEGSSAVRGTFAGDVLIRGLRSSCKGWPTSVSTRELASAAGDPVRSPQVKIGVPMLILSGDRDPVTPPRWGDSLMVQLTHGAHVLLRGVGHLPTFTPCARKLTLDFIRSGGHRPNTLECPDTPVAADTTPRIVRTPSTDPASFTGVWDTYWISSGKETKSGALSLCQSDGAIKGAVQGQGSLPVTGTVLGNRIELKGRNIIEFAITGVLEAGELRGSLQAATLNRPFVARRKASSPAEGC